MRRALATAATILAFGAGVAGGAVLGQAHLDARVAEAQAQTRQAQREAERLAEYLDAEASHQIALNESCWLTPHLTRWVWVRPTSAPIPVRMTFADAWEQGAAHEVRALAWCDK